MEEAKTSGLCVSCVTGSCSRGNEQENRPRFRLINCPFEERGVGDRVPGWRAAARAADSGEGQRLDGRVERVGLCARCEAREFRCVWAWCMEIEELP